MKIVLASDHAGFQMKSEIYEYLKSKNFELKDVGTFSDKSMDYPDTIHPAAVMVVDKKVDLGIILCGSGQGANMTANKHKEIRAALCWNPELAKLSRQHNNANILTLPARFISTEEAFAIIDSFLSTDFEGGRHQNRIDKI